MYSNNVWPKEMGFWNDKCSKSTIGNLILDCHKVAGHDETVLAKRGADRPCSERELDHGRVDREISFDVNGGEGEFDSVMLDYGSEYGELPVPVNGAWDFLICHYLYGW